MAGDGSFVIARVRLPMVGILKPKSQCTQEDEQYAIECEIATMEVVRWKAPTVRVLKASDNIAYRDPNKSKEHRHRRNHKRNKGFGDSKKDLNWTCDKEGNKTVTDVALGDFDIASKSEGGEPRQTPFAIRNAMRRSPEGQTGRGVTNASDMFSFGLVYIYALGGGELLINDYQETASRGISPELEILTRHFCYFGPVTEGLLRQIDSERMPTKDELEFPSDQSTPPGRATSYDTPEIGTQTLKTKRKSQLQNTPAKKRNDLSRLLEVRDQNLAPGTSDWGPREREIKAATAAAAQLERPGCRETGEERASRKRRSSRRGEKVQQLRLSVGE
ncbi:hypothetical protein K458DRAFT_393861 [Lentithecium fluviatile CBS 122367]|uniref:Protein kinase domain-containing protein n=1 Tax=Lentithecium fluviatile CBS 122367 TaxID=1168545 RepID=A0A6G1INJ7_9PLEO|nr:hypothetical protein K458DRAFT_393861 [Lentithecium fluviatile CBS 122367]